MSLPEYEFRRVTDGAPVSPDSVQAVLGFGRVDALGRVVGVAIGERVAGSLYEASTGLVVRAVPVADNRVSPR
jgi:hypothetical protein